MDLSHPIASLTSPATARVLEVLAGTTRPLAGREIGRIAEEPDASVWRALGRLVKAGLVLRDERPVATYYVANRDHLAWPAIESLVRLRSHLVEHIRNEIASWPIQPLHASLYGSFARGDAGPESDIDILLVRTRELDEDVWEAQVAEVRDHIFSWTGNRAQAFVVDPTRLVDHVGADDPLVKAWLHDGVLLVGHPLRQLLPQARARTGA